MKYPESLMLKEVRWLLVPLLAAVAVTVPSRLMPIPAGVAPTPSEIGSGAGEPAGWTRSRAAGLLSQVNLANGNLFTATAMFARVSGRTPPNGIALCHNSIAVSNGSVAECPMGPGWTVLPVANLRIVSPPSGDGDTQYVMTLGDGTEVWFENGQSLGGHFMTLSQVNSTTWKVVTEYQHEFDFDFSVDTSRGRLSSMKNDVGHTLTLTYGTNGLVDRVYDPDGRSVRFEDADTNGLVDRITDESDPTRHVDLTYTSGRLTRISYGPTSNIDLTYDSEGRILTLADFLDDDQNGQPNKWTFEYFPAGDPLAGRVKEVHDPLPHTGSEVYGYADQNGERTASVFDRRGFKWDSVFDDSLRLVREFDPQGHLSTNTWNSKNLPLTVTDGANNTWTYTYDAKGNCTNSKDPLGNLMQCTYTGLNRLATITDACGHTTTLQYTDANFPTRATAVVVPPDGQGAPAATTAVTWYPPTHGAAGLMKDVTDPNGVVTNYGFDAVGSLTSVEDGAGKPNRVLMNYQYDAARSRIGSMAFVTGAGLDPAGVPLLPPGHTAVIDRLQRMDVRSRNAFGMPANDTSNITPNLQPTGAPSPEASASVGTSYQYDFLGRPRQSTRTDNQATVDAGASAVQRAFTFEYFDVVNPSMPLVGSRITAPNGVQTYRAFDSASRLIASNDTLGTMVAYEYHANNLLKAVVRTVAGGAQTRTTYAYYANQSVAEIKLESWNGSAWVASRTALYTYDPCRRPTAIAEIVAGGSSALTTYAYDDRGRLIGEQRTGTSAYARDYTYDQGGNRLSKTILDDEGNVLETTEYVYDVTDQAQYGSQSLANRLMRLEVTNDKGAVVRTQWYYYDNQLGNVREVVRKDDGAAYHYGTQILYQNGNANADRSAWLVLDRKWIADSQGDVVPGTLVWLGATELRQDGYTERGLQQGRDPQTLAKISGAGLWSDYFPESAGGTVASDYSVATSGGAPVVTEVRHFIGNEGEASAQGLLYRHGDGIGTAKSLIDILGNIVREPVFTAFGESVTNGTGGPASRLDGYCSGSGCEEELLPNGWLHMGARLYDPSIGRFLQRDPIGAAGGLNQYVYVGNHPTNAVDPLGLQQSGGCPQGTGRVYPHDFMGPLLPGDTWAPAPLPLAPKGPPPPPAPLPRPPPVNGPVRTHDDGILWNIFAVISHALGHKHCDSCPACRAGHEQHNDMPPTPYVPPPVSPPVPMKCFAAGTEVWTPAGPVAIESLETGDAILTLEEGRVAVGRVEKLDVFVHPQAVLMLDVDGTERIAVTEHHSLRSARGWVASTDIEDDGWAILRADGNLAVVHRAGRETRALTYNVRVAGGDVYFVGHAALVVSD